jgi:N-acetylglucosaminyldiphosphoundecaprenol N-acetyl-beta-D-mannosaminyltransferase
MNDSFNTIKEIRVAGVKVHAVQVEDAVGVIRHWLDHERSFHFISSTNVNNIIMALESRNYFDVMERADISLPDSVPFLWYGRHLGFDLIKRCGIEEVMEALFELSNSGKTYSHFFYGNTSDILDALKKKLLARYPRLSIAGMFSPPFRQLTSDEIDGHVALINDSNADFLWVSLGCPKQELWLYEHRNQLKVVAGGGAGAVFNFLSGQTIKAPKWVRKIGMEWFLRFILEPKRLCKRYMLKYPKFVFYFILQVFLPHSKLLPIHIRRK